MPEQPCSFDEFHLSEPVRRALSEMGFVEPTEVQCASFEPIIEGKDVMVQARTGTGKTAAFGIPLTDRLLTPEKAVQLLVLCPTRELALQVAGELGALGRHRGLAVAPVYGGAAITKQIEQLEDGVQAVVGTPGRVLDHIRRGTLKLGTVRYLILDEADEMLSMGFEKEISSIIERVPSKRQSMLFSATIAPSIQRLAKKYMNEPILLSLSDDYIGAKEVLHSFYMVSGTGRLADLLRIIDVEDPDSALVFCNTRDDVQVVAAGLKRHGFSSDWISSDATQAEREKSMERMREHTVRFLVATDVAARGIDISHVTHVINYTFPESNEVYIHRTGRTGRMGRTGEAISLVTPRDIGNLYFLKLQYRIHPIERDLPTDGELAARRESDLLAMLLGEHGGVAVDPRYLALANRVLQHARGPVVVASLLARVLGGLPAEEAEASRRARPGELVPSSDEQREAAAKRRTRSRSSRTERPREETETPARRPAAAAERPQAAATEERAPELSSEAEGEAEGEGEDGGEFREIYLNAGRRDGVRTSEVARVLEEAGIDRAALGRVRVRDRSSFVSVRAEAADGAVAALDGKQVGDKVVSAEPAKRART